MNSKNHPHRGTQAGWRARATSVAFFALWSASVACGSDFDPSSRIMSLRVLAIQADRSWAAPGDTVSLHTLWHDPITPPRALTWAWATCINPTSSSVVGCMRKVMTDAIAKPMQAPFRLVPPGTDANPDRWSVTVPADAISSLPEVGKPSAMMGIVQIVCPGTIQIDPSFLGKDPPVPIQCIGEGGTALALEDFQISMKRIFLRQDDRNANPQVESITFDGQPWPADEVKTISVSCPVDTNRFDRCKGAVKPKIALKLTPSSFESGAYQNETRATYTEQLVVQYYATEGLFKNDVRRAESPETEFAARKPGEITMWLLGRDDRGGVVWETRRVRVE